MSQGGINTPFSIPIPIPVADGGTGATGFNLNALIYYDGAELNSLPYGSAGQLLTSQGAGLMPVFSSPSGSSIMISGDTGSATSGSFTFTGDTSGLTFDIVGTTADLNGVLVVANGGTGRNTLTNHGVLVGAGTSSITQLAVGATNTVLLGNTGADPSFGQVPTAALVASSITLNNGNNITVTGSPVSLGGAASFNLTGTTNHSVQLGNAGGSLTSLANGTTGQILSAQTGADPIWAAPAASSITITGDTGGSQTGSAFTFNGGPTGLSFGGAGNVFTTTFAGITANGGTVSLATDATASTVNIGTGAGAKSCTFGSTNTTSFTIFQSGSNGMSINSGGGPMGIVSGTGILSISADATNTQVNIGTGGAVKSVTIGSNNTTSSTQIQSGSLGIVANSGTGPLNISTDSNATTVSIATGAAIKALTLGSTNTTSSTTVQGGSNGISMTTLTGNGPITIFSGTGAINISADSNATTVNVATGPAVKTLTMGSTNTTSATVVQSGSGSIIHNTGFRVDSSGRTTNPNQPAFFSFLSATTAALTGDGTVASVIVFNSTKYNQGSSFNTGTGVFTAPITGKYYLQGQVTWGAVAAGQTRGDIFIGTTGAGYASNDISPVAVQASNNTCFITVSAIAPMTAGDTATLGTFVSGGSKTITVNSGGSGAPLSYFCGMLMF